MAGEIEVVLGSWATLQAASSTGDGAISTGTRTVIATALGASESLYPELDLKLEITSGTPTEGNTVDVYLRPKADTDESPAPSGSFLEQHVGTFVLDDTASSKYYLFRVPNWDAQGTMYLGNEGGATLTVALKARGRSSQLAA